MFSFRKKPHKTRDGRLALCLEKHGVDVFFDVGANIGQTGRMLRRNGYKGKIVSFEPLATARVELLQAAAKDADWHIAPAMALGNENGSVDMFVSKATDMSSMAPPSAELLAALPNTKAVAKETVPLARFDSIADEWLSSAQRPFLKIDAQGHDLAVLEGASGVMDTIAGVQIEMSLFPLYEGEPDYRTICAWLHERGFKPWLMQERTFSRNLTRQLQIDGTFFRQ
jgi:FkbM family methyltransferase